MEGIHTVSKFFLLRHSNLSPNGFLSSSLRHGEAVLAKKKVFLKRLNMLSWQKTGKPATSEINQKQKAFEQQCWQGSLLGSWSLPKQRSLPQQTLQGPWATEPPCSTAVQANLSWWHVFFEAGPLHHSKFKKRSTCKEIFSPTLLALYCSQDSSSSPHPLKHNYIHQAINKNNGSKQ